MSYASGNTKQKQEAPFKVVELSRSRANRGYTGQRLVLHEYKYLWKKCIDINTIKDAWMKLRVGKTQRSDVIEIDEDLDYYASVMQTMIFYTRPVKDGGDESRMFTPDKHAPRIITEYGKERETYRPIIWEQWYHHIIVLVLEPIIMKMMHPASCGSLPKRGGVYGKRKIERALKKKSVRYFIKGDIRHFFKHCKIDKLIEIMRTVIKDEWFLFLVQRIYLHYDWLVLGFYPSQWFSNFMLVYFDWYIDRHNPDIYIRYVDDFIIAGQNKKRLQRLLGNIRHYLGSKLRLRLKDNYQVAKFYYKGKGRFIDIMGFVFKRHHTVFRKKNLYKTTKLARRLGKLSVISVGQARSILSRLGWFKHTKADFARIKYIQPNISVKKLKEIVSKHDRRLNHDKLENGCTLPLPGEIRAVKRYSVDTKGEYSPKRGRTWRDLLRVSIEDYLRRAVCRNHKYTAAARG